MRSSSLITKLVASFTVIVAAGYLIIAVVLSIWFQRYFYEVNRQRLEESSSHAVTSVLAYRNKEIDDEALIAQLNLLIGKEGGDVLLIDASGYVNLVSRPLYESLLFSKFSLPNMEALLAGQSVVVSGELNPITKAPSVLFIRPIRAMGTYEGAMVVYVPLSTVAAPLRGIYLRIWSVTLAAMVVSMFFIYYLAQRMLFLPLADLNAIARKISKGEVSQRVMVTSNDEIGQLSDSFNILAESLEKTDKNRREFISNISHELRSPITSIKGFIAGILDGIIPMDKERYYLSIVYDEIQRLSRLVNDLLDLSSMESGNFSIRLTEMDINEIIKICIIKFETKINDKGLKVNVTLEGDHLYVAGDRDRLIQVVTNLLDNAIKHCPDNGVININTRTKGKKVQVSVYNDGDPIPDSDVKYIWDRFYKGDKSRTNKLSTGLGLPIVRNIITQFGEDIWVENREKGVTFVFTLSIT